MRSNQKAVIVRRGLSTVALLLALAAPAIAATFGARPDAITIDAKRPIAQIAFSSLNARPVVFDVTVVPADDVLVVPPVFSLKPYETVLLRVALRRRDPRAQETTYEIRITEVIPPDVKRTPRVVVVPLSVQP